MIKGCRVVHSDGQRVAVGDNSCFRVIAVSRLVDLKIECTVMHSESVCLFGLKSF